MSHVYSFPERESELPSTDSFPKSTQGLWLGQGTSQNLGLNPGLHLLDPAAQSPEP